jgi:RNA polymerase sigma-70 factor (ECF subfamily)
LSQFARRLRTPEERVGMLPNASLPPPLPASTARAEDPVLWRALRDGDEDAFRRVLDRYYPAMLRLALAHVRSVATAEDVVQDTWIAAIDGIERFEGRSSVRTWLFRILRNIARTRGRRDARMAVFTDLEPASADPTIGGQAAPAAAADALWMRGEPPDTRVLSAELRAQLERAIAALPPRQREIIVMRDVEGWSADEVCNAMDISPTNQRVLLHRARDRVRNAIRWYLDENHDCADDDHAIVS